MSPDAEIELLHVVMAAQFSAALIDDAAAFHDVTVVGDCQCRPGVLFNQQDREAELLPQVAKARPSVL